MMKNQAYIDAGSYTSKASFIFDGTRWNAPALDAEINWVIEKAVLDLSLIAWDYDGNVSFSLSGGNAVEHSVKLENLPEYLLDYVTYTTTLNDKTVDNSVSQAGTYKTTCTIADLPANSNYAIGDWPAAVPQTLEWKILPKRIALPTANGSWTVFDGAQHNILSSMTIDTDWEDYYGITLKFDNGSGAVDYDGTTEYGYKYFAFHAGAYSLTLSIKNSLNANVTNVEWVTYAGATEVYSPADQTVTFVVDKAEMEVYDWDLRDESSTVRLRGSYVSDEFVGYKFYTGNTGGGTEVDLDTVLNSNNQTYSIVPYILPEYAADITLTYAAGVATFQSFTTPDLSNVPENDWRPIAGKPYISGYYIEGVYHEFTAEEWRVMLGLGDETSDEDLAAILADSEALSKADVSVIYSGRPVTFAIANWENYYVNQLDVWNGTIDDLTRNDAGSYSITFILKKDTINPRYWKKNDDGTYDRSSVTLSFEIRYLMLSLPEVSDLTYIGEDGEQDILQSSLTEEAYDKLMEEYGDYVEITGNTATDAGTYTLYLTIKDEYVNTVRWDNGTQFGLPGTYAIDWKILPVYLVKPTLDSTLFATFDGYEHSVFEVLEGYKDGELSDELAALQKYARLAVEGGRGINAGTYTAVFTLPNSNYCWTDSFGNIDASTSSVSIIWNISRKYLDLSKVEWNYKEDDPYVYTYENGEEYTFSLELLGVPEELKEYIRYLTDGNGGNTASKVGTYKTVLYLFDSSIDANNYELGAMPSEFYEKYRSDSGYLEITWQIKQREFTVPEDTFGTGILDDLGNWKFDGKVHELMEVLGYKEGWENYLEVSVEFNDGEGWKEYEGYEDSIYKAYYLGSYRLTIKIKDGINTDDDKTVIWSDGTFATEKVVTITYVELEFEIEGWTENDQSSIRTVPTPTSRPTKSRLWAAVTVTTRNSGLSSAQSSTMRASALSLQAKSSTNSAITISAKTSP